MSTPLFFYCIAIDVLLCLSICSCTTQENKNNSDSSTKPEGSKQETSIILSDPDVKKDDKLPSGTITTWQCVYFGSNEIENLFLKILFLNYSDAKISILFI